VTECAYIGHVFKMLHEIDEAVRIAHWEELAAVLPVASHR